MKSYRYGVCCAAKKGCGNMAEGGLDRDAATLHIRCGSDLKAPLVQAGFGGDFLEYSNPLCQGPVVAGENWLDRRAAFVAGAYDTQKDLPEVLDGLRRQEAALHAAASRYERVVLWCEHDSYDQLVLARCLAVFAAAMPPLLALISVDRYPAGFADPAERFIGLGQLPSAALPVLWHGRQVVSAHQARAGAAVWEALRSSDPTRLAALARGGLPLPHLAGAVLRHCRELPWVGDGLSLTERLVLQVLSEGPHTIGAIFGELQRVREPLPWLGDIMLHHIAECMKRVRAPVFMAAFDGEDRRWFKERLTITQLGRAVLAGEVDYLSLTPPERWVGGVCILPGTPCWRWDEQGAAVVVA
jgi:hypothetical protein